MARSGDEVMLALVADGRSCTRPGFIQAMLVEAGQGKTVGLGTPL